MNRVSLSLRASAFLEGCGFGDVGAYEELRGEASFAFDPHQPSSAMITDLERVPRDGDGLVHAAADLRILRPSDARRSNRGIFLDVPNRGNSIFERMTEPDPFGPSTRVTHGWLLRRGFTIVTCGWQHDVPRGGDLFGLTAPVALTEDGSRTPVTGIGFIALRDLVSLLRFEWEREFDFALAMGASQTGRFLRQFVDLGCAWDEDQRMVVDGVLAIAGGARYTEANWRFGQPGEQGSRSLERQVGRQIEPMPRVIELNTSSEYCSSAAVEHVSAARAHVTPDGTADAPLPEHMRWYLMASTQHGPAHLPLTALPDATYYPNTVDYRCFVRAAIDNLQAWVRDGVEPPPSRYPRFADRTLEVREGNLQSTVDADGNEIAGLRHPDVSVPLAMYTGWNPGANGKYLRSTGATIPFSRGRIEERYGDRATYLTQVRQAAEELVGQRWLLADEIENIVADSAARWEQFARLESPLPDIYAKV
jgi:Alpha/beta hydrolase domain